MKKLWLLAGAFFVCSISNYTLAQEDSTTIYVNGLCSMCKDRIEEAAVKVKGVISADWEIGSHKLTVTTNKSRFKEDKLHEAVALVGHDTKMAKASDEAYDKLHACCKYRDPFMVSMHHDYGITHKIFVDGICGMCKDRIEAAVLKLETVKAADWNIESRILTAFSTDTSFSETLLHAAVAAAGHDTKEMTADQDAYDSLDACCKYRDPQVVADHGGREDLLPTSVSGTILVEDGKDNIPLPGVNIYWLNGTNQTVTDEEGHFSLDRPEGADQLVASYVGYYSDTIYLTNETSVDLVLSQGSTLETVEVTYKRKSIEVSFLDAMLTQEIGQGELLKAACCTLAESFETNPAVDVSFTDAVTGARQIEMLGLAGPYVQITRENLPDIRGLSSIYGLVYIPGPWIESIQLAKGAGSVVNGFEAITGQINVELKKPQSGERFFLNLYGNEGSRLEANANARFEVGDHWHTSLMVHGNSQSSQNDRNNDGFVDMPTGSEWTALNRWKYQNDKGWTGQLGIKVSNFDKTSGQLSFDKDREQNSAWGARIQTNRVEGWAKMGKVFLSKPEASIGLQLSGVYHDQNAFFGLRDYDADQQSFYANLIYNDVLGSPSHKISTGLSLQTDQYDETLADAFYTRSETVPGAFFEYTYQPDESFTLVAGLRGDHHNLYGSFLTPRMHLRYAFSDQSVVRLSAGQGRRTASIIAENLGILASSRAIIIDGSDHGLPYGLDQEVAWNFGANLRQTFILGHRELILTLDGYHSRFQQQVVVDFDATPREVRFYNLEGQSYSNAIQAQLDYALLSNMDLRLAYRFNDVKTDFEQGRLERPFVARNRAFINVGYHPKGDWLLDFTLNWQGQKRIPSTQLNPIEFQMEETSPDFVMINAQISKTWWDVFDLYVGVENAFNYQQPNPIIAAEDPFGSYFDSSLIWGPIFGRNIYAGIRYTVE